MRACRRNIEITGTTAYIRIEQDATTIHWYLPNRLTVTLHAPTKKLARAMAKDVPTAALAKLSTRLISQLFDAECLLLPERLPPGAAAYFPIDDAGRLAESAFPVVYRSAD